MVMSQSKDRISEIDDHITKRFEVQKRLGKGAYGIVWKAMDRKTKEVVAVKKIFDAFRNQTDAQRTFREIMFLQSFKHHPNIVKLHSIHRAANNRDIYLGFEYMETDLHNVIKRGNILKDVHKRYIMYQLFKATKYIHSGNVIHRDQKPSNVLLDTLCRCKIADFGLARSLSAPPIDVGASPSPDGDPLLTDYVATRWYRAPEILIANRRYTKGIDMWSLGCILGEMVAGRPIFPGTSTVNQVERIMATIAFPRGDDISTVCVSGIGSSMIKNAAAQTHVPLISLLDPDTPNDALELINKLLVFNPMHRLTAEDALRHTYVSKFHDPSTEISMSASVAIPLNDDVRLSVDDYRNKLYELMAAHQSTRGSRSVATLGGGTACGTAAIRPAPIKAASLIGMCGDGLKMAVNERNRQQQQRCVQRVSCPNHHAVNSVKSKYTMLAKEAKSEPKLARIRAPSTIAPAPPFKIRSDSKIPYHPAHVITATLQQSTNYHDNNRLPSGYKSTTEIMRPTQPQTKSRHETNLVKKRPNPNKTAANIYMSFNSYNQSHGIITQSALMELRAAGIK